MLWWLVPLVVALAFAVLWALYRSWRRDVRDIVIQHKADEYTNEVLQRERAQADSRLENLPPLDKVVEFDRKTSGEPE